jgi:hypothetical protein
VHHVRLDHDPQRCLLQVPELRHDVRLRLSSCMRRRTSGAPRRRSLMSGCA